jgi:hypothetical protein
MTPSFIAQKRKINGTSCRNELPHRVLKIGLISSILSWRETNHHFEVEYSRKLSHLIEK